MHFINMFTQKLTGETPYNSKTLFRITYSQTILCLHNDVFQLHTTDRKMVVCQMNWK
jgi:hypothetical protein